MNCLKRKKLDKIYYSGKKISFFQMQNSNFQHLIAMMNFTVVQNRTTQCFLGNVANLESMV